MECKQVGRKARNEMPVNKITFLVAFGDHSFNDWVSVSDGKK